MRPFLDAAAGMAGGAAVAAPWRRGCQCFGGGAGGRRCLRWWRALSDLGLVPASGSAWWLLWSWATATRGGMVASLLLGFYTAARRFRLQRRLASPPASARLQGKPLSGNDTCVSIAT
ncbi:uncharacterized protein [Triticum aestivum]|uniref:uncharacterized protein n=1 Tax=Triticum aestivum TaxID=4565 RepID=UPI001D009A0C|nr:uncharacterized protein LOC123128310 [Triticum aestivum]